MDGDPGAGEIAHDVQVAGATSPSVSTTTASAPFAPLATAIDDGHPDGGDLQGRQVHRRGGVGAAVEVAQRGPLGSAGAGPGRPGEHDELVVLGWQRVTAVSLGAG